MRRLADPFGYSSGHFVGDVGNRAVLLVAMRAAPRIPHAARRLLGALCRRAWEPGGFVHTEPGAPGYTPGGGWSARWGRACAATWSAAQVARVLSRSGMPWAVRQAS